MAVFMFNDIIEATAPVLMLNRRADPTSTTAIATLELSVVDAAQDFYVALFFYYKATGDGINDCVETLQAALEELLGHYPCAAGVLAHNEANNGRLEVRYPAVLTGGSSNAACGYSFGVPFHVAHAAVTLSDLGDPWLAPPEVTDSLQVPAPLPVGLYSKSGRFVMAFQVPLFTDLQVTIFKCGGFCVGFTYSHVYMDGHAAGQLMQNLCSIARGAGLTSQPQITQRRTTVFKPRSPPLPRPPPHYRTPFEHSSPSSPSSCFKTSECLQFPLEELEALRRHMSTKRCQSRQYSRNTCLLALLWSAHARVCLEVRELSRNHVLPLILSVDLRRRQFPGVGESYVGNAVYDLSIWATLQEIYDSELSDLVNRIQNTMVGFDFVESMQSVVDFLGLEVRDGLPHPVTGLNVASYVHFPYYDTNYGWGNPLCVGLPSRLPMNMCFVLDNPAARAWNVIFVLSSVEERACFKQHIIKCMDSIL